MKFKFRRFAPQSSLHWRILLGLLLPITLFIVLDTWSLHRKALQSLNTAYDRTLLASARSIAEQLAVKDSKVHATVPYAALDIFEADNRSRMYYRVLGFNGEFVSGYPDLPTFDKSANVSESPYAALVSFYDANYNNEPVRMAMLYQPMTTQDMLGVAVIQVAETLEIRLAETRKILVDTLLRQALLLLMVFAITWLVVSRALQPLESLRRALLARQPSDLSPVEAPDVPRELGPAIAALNEVMARLQRLADHQQQFVRNASHQLRTPLAVMKTQIQLAERGDLSPKEALRGLAETAERATALTNQLLALAKIEQIRSRAEFAPINLAAVASTIALELSPLIAARDLDFELDTGNADAVLVNGHEWMLRELVRNLLANAIGHTPMQQRLGIRLCATGNGNELELQVWNEGAAIPDALHSRLFTPFTSGDPADLGGKNAARGTGLGLAICKEICSWLGGSIAISNSGNGSSSVCVVARLPVQA